jgi:hypothetical protein
MNYEDNRDDWDGESWVDFIDEYHCTDYWTVVDDAWEPGDDDWGIVEEEDDDEDA